MPADPLPVVPTLTAGQALDSYLEHLADANGITTAQLLATIGAGPRQPGGRFLMLAPSAAAITAMSALSGITPAELRRHTLARYDGNALDLTGLDPTDTGTYRIVAARGWLPSRGTQICPACLHDTGTWSLAWRLPTAAVCTAHHCYLVAHCPTCRRPFRDQRHSHLRRVGASTACGNPIGQGPRSQCTRDLTTIATHPADPACIERQQRHDRALAGAPIAVLGHPTSAQDYLHAGRALTTLLLHLAAQPRAASVAAWTSTLSTEAAARTIRRGPRWGLRPPNDPALRSRALTTADHILTAPDLDAAATRAAPWIELTPPTPAGPLAWIGDRSPTNPTVSRIIAAALAPHRRLSHRLDDEHMPTPLRHIPQVIPLALYHSHLAGLLTCDAATTRLFAALCLARAGHDGWTWATAAHALGLPGDLAIRTARAASARMNVTPDVLIAHLHTLSRDMPRTDYRHLERAVADTATRTDWFLDWVTTRPGTRYSSQPLAVTWLWVHVANAQLSTTPATHADGASWRARYRSFEASLTAQQRARLRAAAT